MIYVIEVVSQDETTSRHGTVAIIWPSLGFAGILSGSTYHRESRRLLDSQPIRHTRLHICLEPIHESHDSHERANENTMCQIVCNLLLVSMSPRERIITKLHTGEQLFCTYRQVYTFSVELSSLFLSLLVLTPSYKFMIIAASNSYSIVLVTVFKKYENPQGSRTETEYLLKDEYGIPVRDIPLTCTGQIKLTQWRQWIKFRQTMDAQHARTCPLIGVGTTNDDVGRDLSKMILPARGHEGTPIECPDLTMVVFRNGGTMFHHPANKVFRTILTTKEEDRERACTNKEKQAIITAIIQDAWALGFDFCRWDNDQEYFIKYDRTGDDEALRGAVAVALRDNIKRNRTRKKAQMGDRPGNDNNKRSNNADITSSMPRGGETFNLRNQQSYKFSCFGGARKGHFGFHF
jgi:hypothetical protein